MSLFVKYWFFAGIAAVVVIAFAFPPVGIFLQTYKILDCVIFAAFLLTGLTLETSSILKQLRSVKILMAALASSLFLIPVLAYATAFPLFGMPSDFTVGVLINGVVPVTIASGIVMTAMALGNVPLSLFLCISCNAVAVFTIPFMLDLLLGMGSKVTLPVLQMLTGLVIKVLVPTIIGQLLRPLVKNVIASCGKAVSIFNQCLVLLIILNAVSSSTNRIVEAGFAVLSIVAYMLVFHVVVLLLNYGLSRVIRLDSPSTAAFTIHVSQKTLTVSFLVWSGYFAKAFPMALIPAITYHIIQMIMDTFVAESFRRKHEKSISPS